MSLNCSLFGLPVQSGASQPGCLMGPDAMRTAGLQATLQSLGHEVTDQGNLQISQFEAVKHSNASIHNLSETAGWIEAISELAYNAMSDRELPIFLGGDHSMSAGTVTGVSRHAAEQQHEQFVLWLDAHADIHTLNTTTSGHLHGTPVGYFIGREGFDGFYPAPAAVVPESNICMIGIRSVDEAENKFLRSSEINVRDMRSIDEFGVVKPLRAFLEKVRDSGGALHVSLDVDFLEPTIAPAVGTTIPGGATFREAHLIMEMLCDSQLVTSLDLAELNPFLDERGRTATLICDLCASLFGRKVIDRQTRSF